ncbi:ribosomal RNA small subunit methyltransferase G [Impatiens glandulifera]|uniref:ribosomal RNA small subunit methyltransferase G n=1 Tax=Impatiens glandulifera TaxID=253017 RepID=UPI001FB074BB|nr:ribosomal RNA small subunit methyltransferase G [Impatiens glandulifera]
MSSFVCLSPDRIMLSFCSNRILRAPSSLSLGTFIEHLPTFSPSASTFRRINRKAFTTNASLSTPLIEALSPRQKEQIDLYVDTLLQWNQKMNLTAVTEKSEVMERHIDDSMAIIPPIQTYLSQYGTSFDDLKLVDVGSGAGLPGLVLAIACPGWKVTLMESMVKRCAFLEHTAGLIGLSNVRVIRGRAEDFGQDRSTREIFDVAVARAVAEMRVLAEYCLPLVRVGGLFVAAKGHDPALEVRRAEKAVSLMGASILQICSVESHGPYGQRTAIVVRKDNPTPRKYPRDPGIPARLPL